MALPPVRLRNAGISARRRRVSLVLAEGEVLETEVGIVSLAVEGSVDGTAELLRACEATDRRGRGGLVVGVGCGDDNFEAIAPLPLVGGFGGGDGDTPECALVVCHARRVGAVLGVRVEAGVTFWQEGYGQKL